ncbi:MAG: ABC transporter permease [Chloroflexi bacterium]|nr:ABC transporter permease [Chloroflexota bacterium]
MDTNLLILTLASMLADSSPLVFAVIGETLSEKSGVTNLSLDGTILLSAMVGFAVAFTTDNLYLAFLAAMLVGALIAAIIAFSSIVLKLDQIAVGFVLTLLCGDLSTFFGNPFVRKPYEGVQNFPIPLLADIPVIGRIFFNQNVVVYLSVILIFAAWWWIYKTQLGLKLQGIGEKPAAAFARGTNVNLQRFIYTLIGGALVGFGGAAYSLFVKLGWSYHHTYGLGWIALSIVIFGGWHPVRAAIGAYIFGGLQSVSGLAQSIPAFANVPTQVFQTAPFAVMIIALLVVSNESIDRFFSGSPMSRKIWQSLRGMPPGALGTTFEQE